MLGQKAKCPPEWVFWFFETVTVFFFLSRDVSKKLKKKILLVFIPGNALGAGCS
jgi:hypothetical protein